MDISSSSKVPKTKNGDMLDCWQVKHKSLVPRDVNIPTGLFAFQKFEMLAKTGLTDPIFCFAIFPKHRKDCIATNGST